MASPHSIESRECRCPFCGELGSYGSEAECSDHMANCFALQAQLNRASGSTVCRNCRKPASTSCDHCNSVSYCGEDCKLSDWKTHEQECSLLKAQTDALKKGGDEPAAANGDAVESSCHRIVDQDTETTQTSWNISPNDRIVLSGLQARPELNGAKGVVLPRDQWPATKGGVNFSGATLLDTRVGIKLDVVSSDCGLDMTTFEDDGQRNFLHCIEMRSIDAQRGPSCTFQRFRTSGVTAKYDYPELDHMKRKCVTSTPTLVCNSCGSALLS